MDCSTSCPTRFTFEVSERRAGSPSARKFRFAANASSLPFLASWKNSMAALWRSNRIRKSSLNTFSWPHRISKQPEWRPKLHLRLSNGWRKLKKPARNARGLRPGCGCRGNRWLVSMKQIRYAENVANGFAPCMARENWRMRSKESRRPTCFT